ncbi:hypothetical protein RSAG8_09921, partial [Rhizoctonia solani AG-8 WAC10335]
MSSTFLSRFRPGKTAIMWVFFGDHGTRAVASSPSCAFTVTRGLPAFLVRLFRF